MLYNFFSFLLLLAWCFGCFKSLEKIRQSSYLFDESIEKLLYFSAMFIGPVIWLGVFLYKRFTIFWNQLENKLEGGEEKEKRIIYLDHTRMPVFEGGNTCGVHGEGVLVLGIMMKELIASEAQSARLLPKPNKTVAVNFVTDKVESRQFELNQTLGMELIAGIKMAAGMDPESHKELQQGYFKVKYDGQEILLEVRSQGFFGGEKLYMIKRPAQEMKTQQGDEEVEALKK
ncbi:MAG: hypothetical protein IJZ19_03075 [Lentisphaeria bacterium]|nr:hypothetical protein [Lentisphaeria bacterium]MBQ8753986.1 hypothetical protein [Lentisphaeria bacterium]